MVSRLILMPNNTGRIVNLTLFAVRSLDILMVCHIICPNVFGGDMSQADDIRSFVKSKYIDPAREKNAAKVSIRAGDVHKDMALSQSLPAVCCAIGTNKFEKLCNISRVSINGPINGANTIYTFEII